MYIGDATHSAKSVQLSVSNNLRRNLDADEAIWRGVQHTFPARSQLLAPIAILSKIDMIARSNGNSMETIGISHCRLPQTSGEFRNLALGISKSKRLCRSQKHRPSQTQPRFRPVSRSSLDLFQPRRSLSALSNATNACLSQRLTRHGWYHVESRLHCIWMVGWLGWLAIRPWCPVQLQAVGQCQQAGW